MYGLGTGFTKTFNVSSKINILYIFESIIHILDIFYISLTS